MTGCDFGDRDRHPSFVTAPVSLSYNQWKDGTADGEVTWYFFGASTGTSYQVRWNTEAPSGDGTKTLPRASVSAFTSTGAALFTDITDGWDTGSEASRTVSGYGGTVYVKLSATATGTYAVKYFDPAGLPPQTVMSISAVEPTPGPSCRITWNAWNSASGIRGYHLYRSTDNTDYTEIARIGLPTNSYTDTDVSAGTTYYYQVSAYNADGEGKKSAPVSATAASITGTALVHNTWADSALAVVGAEEWYTFEAESAKTYQLMWNVGTARYGDGTKTLRLAAVSAFKSDGTPLFTGMTDGWDADTYDEKRRSVSGYSGTVYVKVAGYGSVSPYTGTYAVKYFDPSGLPPQAVMIISAVEPIPGPSCFIKWNVVSGISGYHLYRSTDDTGYTEVARSDTNSYNTGYTEVARPDTNSYTDTGLSAGTTYYYQVSAYNANGEGEKSAPVSDTAASIIGTALTLDEWTDARISADGQVDWYTFEAEPAKTYQVRWNAGTSAYGDGTKTLEATEVSAFTSDGAALFTNITIGWETGPYYEARRSISGYSGTIYVRVIGHSFITFYTGTYAVSYSEQQ
jgi:fibronectin type 3 domain-containing protein